MAERRYEIYLQTFSGRFSNISEHFPKITEDCRGRPKKIRRCFDHTPINLSVVKGTKDHFSKMTPSQVRILYHFYRFVTTRYTTEFYLHENEPVGRTPFHMNGFARRLILMQRQQALITKMTTCFVLCVGTLLKLYTRAW